MTRTLSAWCREGNHVLCRALSTHCQCSCHGDTTAADTEEVFIPKTSPSTTRARRLRAARPKTPKEQAQCCVAQRDDLGRLPIGFCGPDCIRRPR